MNYLATTDYLTYGLEATTDPSWMTAASAIIDAHCRRVTLGVNQYEERLKMPPEIEHCAAELSPAGHCSTGDYADRDLAGAVRDSTKRRVAFS